MHIWTASEINELLEILRKNDTLDVARELSHIAEIDRSPHSKPVPTGDSRVITCLEQLVKDNRACIINWLTPYTYGELRWLAARVLACEYAYQGINKNIFIKDVIQPIRTTGGGLYSLDYLDKQIQRGLLPTTTEIIKPQDYCEWCSKEAIEKRRREQETDK